MTEVMSEMTRTQPKRSRRAVEAAESALDVMLTDAAVGGPSRMLRPGQRPPDSRSAWPATRSATARRMGGLGVELARVAGGRSDVRAGQARPALRRPGLGVKLAAAAAAADPPGGRATPSTA